MTGAGAMTGSMTGAGVSTLTGVNAGLWTADVGLAFSLATGETGAGF